MTHSTPACLGQQIRSAGQPISSQLRRWQQLRSDRAGKQVLASPRGLHQTAAAVANAASVPATMVQLHRSQSKQRGQQMRNERQVQVALVLQDARQAHTQQVQHSSSMDLQRVASDTRPFLANRGADFIPANTPEGVARQLTAHISKRRHWAQVQQIWLDNSTSFSPIHLTAAMTRLVKLVAEQDVNAADRPELFKFSSALMSSVQQNLSGLDSRGAAQCLWAYAKLQAVSPHRSRSGDAAADALTAAIAQQHMQKLQQQELLQVAWAAAILKPAGLSIPQALWPGFEQRMLQLLPVAQPAAVACAAWAAAKTGRQPPTAYIQGLLQHAAAGISTYGARELVQLVLAVGSWQFRVPDSWLCTCCTRLQQLLPQQTPQDTSNALLAFARLRVRPEANFLAQLLQHQLQLLQRMRPSVLATVVYALAKLQHNPGLAWWARFLPFAIAGLHCCSPTTLAITAWAIAKLQVHPGQGFVDEILQQSGYMLPGFAAHELSMLLCAFSSWGAVPAAWWWERFEQVSKEQLADFTAAELGVLLHGIVSTGAAGVLLRAETAASAKATDGAAATVPTVGIAPASCGTQQQLDFFAAAAQQSSGLAQQPIQPQLQESGQHQQQLVVQQQNQQRQQLWQQPRQCQLWSVSGPWVSKLLLVSEQALAGAPASCLVSLLTGLARLHIQPISSWLTSFEVAATAAMPGASVNQVAAVLWGYATLRVQPGRQLLSCAHDRVWQLVEGSHGDRMSGSSSSCNGVGGSSNGLSNKWMSSVEFLGNSNWQGGIVDDSSSRLAAGMGSKRSCSQGLVSISSSGSSGSRESFSGFTTAVAVQLLWSLTRLQDPVVPPWVDGMLYRLSPQLQRTPRRMLVTMLWLLARLGHIPACPGWVDKWWEACARSLGVTAAAAAAEAAGGSSSTASHSSRGQQNFQNAAAGADCSICSAAAAGPAGHSKLQQQQQQLVYSHSNYRQQTTTSNCSSSSPAYSSQPAERSPPVPAAVAALPCPCDLITVVLCCFERLGVTPSSSTHWWQDVAAATQQLLPGLSCKQLCKLIGQVARLRVWPGEEWCAAAAAALIAQQKQQQEHTRMVRQARRDLQHMGYNLWGSAPLS